MMNVKKEAYSLEVHNESAYFIIRWSRYLVLKKFEVVKKAPNRAGIFVLFYLNKSKDLQPFYIGYSWASSIKYDLRLLLLEDANRDRALGKIIDDNKCYYKFVIIDKYNDLIDLYDILKNDYKKKNVQYFRNINDKYSGRFNEIFVTDYSQLIKQR
jgi:hypothetical protein